MNKWNHPEKKQLYLCHHVHGGGPEEVQPEVLHLALPVLVGHDGHCRHQVLEQKLVLLDANPIKENRDISKLS